MATEIKLETGGSVWKLLVSEGQSVSEGQELFIMEVMKMEMPYEAPISGTITKLNIAEEDVVEEGHCAMVIE